MHPFQFGAEYPRTDLLAFVGSRQGQSGVLWGAREPGCMICTTGGRHGRSAGYHDAPSERGWIYFGQGAKGDQDIRAAANARLASGRYSILLFTGREPSRAEVKARHSYAKLFAFRGEFNVLGYDKFCPAEGTRAGQQLLRFELIRVNETIGEDMTFAAAGTTPPVLESVKQALNFAALSSKDPATRLAVYYKRSNLVRQYALMRADGVCEGCDLPGPFMSSAGVPYLEVHHLLRLADDGPDEPANVAALCPNCHKRAHLSQDREDFQTRLSVKIRELELRQVSD